VIRSAPYYWVVCDGCWRSAQEESDYAAWADEEQAVEVCMEGSDWTFSDDRRGHYCPACTQIRLAPRAEQPPSTTGGAL